VKYFSAFKLMMQRW